MIGVLNCFNSQTKWSNNGFGENTMSGETTRRTSSAEARKGMRRNHLKRRTRTHRKGRATRNSGMTVGMRQGGYLLTHLDPEALRWQSWRPGRSSQGGKQRFRCFRHGPELGCLEGHSHGEKALDIRSGLYACSPSSLFMTLGDARLWRACNIGIKLATSLLTMLKNEPEATAAVMSRGLPDPQGLGGK